MRLDDNEISKIQTIKKNIPKLRGNAALLRSAVNKLIESDDGLYGASYIKFQNYCKYYYEDKIDNIIKLIDEIDDKCETIKKRLTDFLGSYLWLDTSELPQLRIKASEYEGKIDEFEMDTPEYRHYSKLLSKYNEHILKLETLSLVNDECKSIADSVNISLDDLDKEISDLTTFINEGYPFDSTIYQTFLEIETPIMPINSNDDLEQLEQYFNSYELSIIDNYNLEQGLEKLDTNGEKAAQIALNIYNCFAQFGCTMPYNYGAKNISGKIGEYFEKKGIDCSGFIGMIEKLLTGKIHDGGVSGINEIGSNCRSMTVYSGGKLNSEFNFNNIQPGDIVTLWDPKYSESSGKHTGIVVGIDEDNIIIAESVSGKGLTLTKLDREFHNIDDPNSDYYASETVTVTVYNGDDYFANIN